MVEQFCECQIKTREDTENSWTCCADLASGRAYKCPFSLKELQIINGFTVMSHEGVGLGQCQDWKFPKELKVRQAR